MTEPSYLQICEVPITFRSPSASSGYKQRDTKSGRWPEFPRTNAESQAGLLAAMCFSRWIERASFKNIQTNLLHFLWNPRKPFFWHIWAWLKCLFSCSRLRWACNRCQMVWPLRYHDGSRHIDLASFRPFKKAAAVNPCIWCLLLRLWPSSWSSYCFLFYIPPEAKLWRKPTLFRLLWRVLATRQGGLDG